MTINAKTKVETLKGLINANFSLLKKNPKAKDLMNTIAYTKEHEDKATRIDFMNMVKEAMKILGDKFITEPVMAEEKPVEVKTEEKKSSKVVKKSEKTAPAAENSVKKPVRSKAVKEAEEDTDEEDEETEEVKKPAVKKTAKKSAKKAEGVKVLENSEASDKALQMAKNFPETLTIDGEEFKLNHDIKTMDDLLDAYMDDVEIEFAFYWTKRHLRQFKYFDDNFGRPKSFPNDLDTAQLVYVDDANKKVAYCVSDSNFPAPYSIFPEDLEEDNGVRYCNGVEYQIYTKEAEE